jgi:hypothetical protein
VSARAAEALGARLPALQVAANRVAATVWQGVHGRRRVGPGDSVWQYRPYMHGDETRRIDWRKSAMGEDLIVREMEWEAAQTVCLWRDASPSMLWHSKLVTTEKRQRADLLLLALAALLLRGGERVRLIGGPRSVGGGGLDRLADDLARLDPGDGLPPAAELPRHARVVLFGDFLSPPEAIAACVGSIAGRSIRGHLVQILDPAEVALPYHGRIRFTGLEREAPALVPRVDGLRDAYHQRLAAQQDNLAAIAAGAGWGLSAHRTDAAPETLLLALYVALSGERSRR